MSGGVPLEIERKFLIRRPEESMLDSLCTERWEITQTYLRRREERVSRRVRRVVCGGEISYYYNEKTKLSPVTRIEREELVEEARYRELLEEAEPTLSVIEKTRWRIPLGELLMEIDVYPFWAHQAFCEVELPDEETPLTLPSWVELLREVSAERGYTNLDLAKHIPDEDEEAQRSLGNHA